MQPTPRYEPQTTNLTTNTSLFYSAIDNISSFNVLSDNISSFNVPSDNISSFNVQSCNLISFNIQLCNVASFNLQSCNLASCKVPIEQYFVFYSAIKCHLVFYSAQYQNPWCQFPLMPYTLVLCYLTLVTRSLQLLSVDLEAVEGRIAKGKEVATGFDENLQCSCRFFRQYPLPCRHVFTWILRSKCWLLYSGKYIQCCLQSMVWQCARPWVEFG